MLRERERERERVWEGYWGGELGGKWDFEKYKYTDLDHLHWLCVTLCCIDVGLKERK
jgi:hypothetical protein